MPYMYYNLIYKIFIYKDLDVYKRQLIGIDEEQFDYVNQSLDNPIDKQDFLNGESCIVQYEVSEIPKKYFNQLVFFNLQGKQYEITVEAVSYDTQYSGRDIGASLIVSQDSVSYTHLLRVLLVCSMMNS